MGFLRFICVLLQKMKMLQPLLACFLAFSIRVCYDNDNWWVTADNKEERKMKKFLCMLLAAMLLLTMTAAQAESLLGGWTLVESAMSDEDKTDVREAAYAAFDKAMTGFVGSNVEVVDVLATQVVAGTNYMYLAVVTPVVPDAQSHYALVEVYADLEGNATITGMKDIGEPLTGLAGGWTEVTEMDPDELEIIWSALDTLNEEDIYPYCFVVMAQQVVAGVNYQLLVNYALPVEAAPAEGQAEPAYTLADAGLALATVYVDLQGKASLSAFEPLALSVQD